MRLSRNIFIVLLICITLGAKNLDKPIFKLESPFKTKFRLVHNPVNLLQAVDNTSDFLSKIHLSKFITFHVGIFEKYNITIEDVKSTLRFVKETLEKTPEKMADAEFLGHHFNFYRWYVRSDHSRILHGHYGPPDYIITTSYLIAQIPGSAVRTEKYTIPLYRVPADERRMTPAEINQNKSHLLRFVFTRKEIIGGVFNDNIHVPLLGWVTLEDYKELVLQGSAIIDFGQGVKKLCNAINNNGKKGSEQYYFFSIKENTVDSKSTKFPVKPDPVAGVTLAGNIEGLGLGKLFLMVSYNYGMHTWEGRYGLLTDTGEAFKDNFHQVDMFAGYFAHKKDFKDHIVGLPHTARQYLMIKKK
jgi:hypothetical protein